MATPAELDAYQSDMDELVGMARRDLMDLYRGVQGNDPQIIRDALLEFLPVLAERYGQVASALAAEWFEGLPSLGWATLAPPVSRSVVEKAFRYRAGGLWGDDPDSVIDALAGNMHLWVRGPARDTIRNSAHLNGRRWVRVPRGEKTCAFCLMLASRSAEWMMSGGPPNSGMNWLYTSRWEAQHRGRGQTQDKYHDWCDCAIVPVNGPSEVPWDPEPFYAVYNAAAEAVGDRADTSAILAQIRRDFPDAVNDGVHAKPHQVQEPAAAMAEAMHQN